MLIILVVLAVVLSLAAEFIYSCVQEMREASWVRSDVRAHHGIVRATGKVAFKPIRVSERQMNAAFKEASDPHW
jgi:hypothetical protein